MVGRLAAYCSRLVFSCTYLFRLKYFLFQRSSINWLTNLETSFKQDIVGKSQCMELPPLGADVLAQYHSCVPGLKKVDGIPWHGSMVPLEDFPMRDDDIFVTGYPKSGNHWLGEIIYMTVIGGDETMANQKKITERIHWLELDPVQPGGDSLQRLDDLPSPRLLMTHNVPRQCPRPGGRKFKTVVITRNPKDVAVSFYKFHQMLDFIRYGGSFQDFLSLYLHGEVMHGCWFDVVLDWWKRKDDPDVCFIKYEDLKKDLRSGVKKLASFLDKPLNEDQITAVVKHCTFDQMKSNPMSNVTSDFMNEQVSPFLRKGTVGDWKNFFTVAQNEMFDKYYESRMKDSGLHIDFE